MKKLKIAIQMVQSYCQTKARDRGVKARKPEGIQQTSVLVIFYQHIEKKLCLCSVPVALYHHFKFENNAQGLCPFISHYFAI
jgi:hypothetical protein